jgi:ABC-2 type transport system ATP-binding protein
MNAMPKDRLTALDFPVTEVQSGVDALSVHGLSKRFVASADKSKLPPARGIGKLLRRLRPPKRIKVAVDNVDMAIPRGEIFGVVGHNGCGKSTLIRMLSTLLTPDDGSIRIFGLDPVRQPYQVQRLLNRVSVDAAFFKKLSAYENLLYAARLYGVEDKAALKRAEEILKVLGLEEGRLTDSLQELSRGMQQKVAIARALLTSPVMLLLDEPTTGLDPKSKRDVQAFVLSLRQQHDATVLLTSHDMDEVEKLCDRIALMSDGRFVMVGTAEELKQAVRERKIGRGEEVAGDVSMEDVFIELTGQQWQKEDEPEAA